MRDSTTLAKLAKLQGFLNKTLPFLLCKKKKKGKEKNKVVKDEYDTIVLSTFLETAP